MVEGEAKVKRLSMKLEASGLVVTKYALNGVDGEGIDRATGEEIYYNTKLPTGRGQLGRARSEALNAIGDKIADEFSRDFFLSHVTVTGRKVALKVDGLPPASVTMRCARELVGCLRCSPSGPRRPRASTSCSSPATARPATSWRPAS